MRMTPPVYERPLAYGGSLVHARAHGYESSLYANGPLYMKDLVRMKDLSYMQEPMDMSGPSLILDESKLSCIFWNGTYRNGN